MKRALELSRLGFSILLVAVTLTVLVPYQHAFAQQATPPATAALSEATIRALQEALGKQGFTVAINGVLNDETRAEIRKYQSAHHLPVTGEPDKATLDKLGVRLSAAQSPIVAQGTTPPMQPGQMPQGGMMMNDPMMMQGMMTGMMQMMQGMMGMMQGQKQPGSMQPPPGPGGMMMNCPMMGAGSQGTGPAMMQMMQGMMKMMQMMQSQRQAGHNH